MNISDLQNLMDRLAHQIDEGEEIVSADQERQLEDELSRHPEWADEMRSRELFDVQLRDSLCELQVPTGGQDRLLALLEESAEPNVEDSSELLNTQPATTQERPSRRRVIGIFSAACLLFVASLGVFLSTLTPVLTVAEVQQNIPRMWDLSTEELLPTDVAISSSATLPNGDWENSRIHYQTDWSLTELNSTAGQFAEFRKFSFQSSRGIVHNGLLVSLPTAKFPAEEHPSATSPFSADIRYLSTPSGLTLAIVTWTNPETNSLCFLAVPAESRTLDALDALLYVNPV
jgi:hypothetical protein